MILKQNNFSRSLANDKKMGAYYTDTRMAERMGHLFYFPKEEVSILEPSCGDMKALESLLRQTENNAKEHISTKIFGVEINENTYAALREEKNYNLLNADFLTGVKISHNSFGFCFSNPPYGTDENGVRLEQKFLEKLYPYLKKDAPLCIVVPFYLLQNERFLKSYLSRFVPKGIYRFDDEIYAQFQQIVLVGTKRPSIGFLKSKYEDFFQIKKEDIPYLPHEDLGEKKIAVIASEEDKIEYFTTLVFNKEEAAKHLKDSPLNDRLSNFFVPAYTGSVIGRPPVPLKKDFLYLLAVSGGGQGKAGSEENRDLHLQRGVAKVITDSVKEDGIIKERSSTKMSLTIIENDGMITELS